jgi:hypothetical protein
MEIDHFLEQDIFQAKTDISVSSRPGSSWEVFRRLEKVRLILLRTACDRNLSTIFQYGRLCGFGMSGTKFPQELP